MVLDRVFDGCHTGLYVDVGAHHPWRFSNTYAFYRRGWSGVNIDPTPGVMAHFGKARPRDVNLEIGISRDGRGTILFMFDDPAMNTMDPRLAAERGQGPWLLIREVPVATARLADVLDKHVEGKIDFLNVDVEGLDQEVLESNDWERSRPYIVLVELFGRSMAEVVDSTVASLLAKQDYELFAKTVNTAFFRDRSSGG